MSIVKQTTRYNFKIFFGTYIFVDVVFVVYLPYVCISTVGNVLGMVRQRLGILCIHAHRHSGSKQKWRKSLKLKKKQGFP